MCIEYSVIIPLYNREKTLRRCLDSLLCQNREDVQILVIDDGSTDSSGQIARSYSKKYSTLEYHYQENAGVSAARNVGLEHARGKYVTFVDSDDYVTSDYFSSLDMAVKEKDWDLLTFREISDAEFEEHNAALFDQLGKRVDSFERMKLMLSSRLIMRPGNKCFKNAIIQEHRLRFVPGLNIAEDFVFCMTYALHSRVFEICPTAIYFRDTSDENSLSRKYRPNLEQQINCAFNHIKVAIDNSEIYSVHREEILSMTDYLYIKNVCSCIAERFKAGKINYFSNRNEFIDVCRSFRDPLSLRCCGIVHSVMRVFLKQNWFFPFYAVTVLVKGKKC